MPMRRHTANPIALAAYDVACGLLVATVLFFPFLVDWINHP